MSITQVSKIQVRTGNLADLPQLSTGELGWAADQKRLYIGNDPATGNTEVLTEFSVVVGKSGLSGYSGKDGQSIYSGYSGFSGASAPSVSGYSGAAYVGFLQGPIYSSSGYSGAVVTNLQVKNRQVISVLDFGADLTGATYSDAAFAAAWAAVKLTGGTLLVPQGIYTLNSTWTIDIDQSAPHNYDIMGYGAVLKAGPAVTGFAVQILYSYNINHGLKFEGFQFDHKGNSTVGGCILARGTCQLRLVKCSVEMDITSSSWAFIQLQSLVPGNDDTGCFLSIIDECAARPRLGEDQMVGKTTATTQLTLGSNVMTVVATDVPIEVGMTISDYSGFGLGGQDNIPFGTVITAQTSGTPGGAGTYTISNVSVGTSTTDVVSFFKYAPYGVRMIGSQNGSKIINNAFTGIVDGVRLDVDTLSPIPGHANGVRIERNDFEGVVNSIKVNVDAPAIIMPTGLVCSHNRVESSYSYFNIGSNTPFIANAAEFTASIAALSTVLNVSAVTSGTITEGSAVLSSAITSNPAIIKSTRTVTTVSSASATNRITLNSSDSLDVDGPIQFISAIGGLTAGVNYYVKSKPTSTTITVSATIGGPTVALTDTVVVTTGKQFPVGYTYNPITKLYDSTIATGTGGAGIYVLFVQQISAIPSSSMYISGVQTVRNHSNPPVLGPDYTVTGSSSNYLLNPNYQIVFGSQSTYYGSAYNQVGGPGDYTIITDSSVTNKPANLVIKNFSNDSSYFNAHLVLGQQHYWTDEYGKLRTKNTQPNYSTDGQLVANQGSGASLPTMDNLFVNPYFDLYGSANPVLTYAVSGGPPVGASNSAGITGSTNAITLCPNNPTGQVCKIQSVGTTVSNGLIIPINSAQLTNDDYISCGMWIYSPGITSNLAVIYYDTNGGDPHGVASNTAAATWQYITWTMQVKNKSNAVVYVGVGRGASFVGYIPYNSDVLYVTSVNDTGTIDDGASLLGVGFGINILNGTAIQPYGTVGYVNGVSIGATTGTGGVGTYALNQNQGYISIPSATLSTVTGYNNNATAYVGGFHYAAGLNAPQTVADSFGRESYIFQGSGAPAYRPAYIGQRYYDTGTGGHWYMAKGTSTAADWVAIS